MTIARLHVGAILQYSSGILQDCTWAQSYYIRREYCKIAPTTPRLQDSPPDAVCPSDSNRETRQSPKSFKRNAESCNLALFPGNIARLPDLLADAIFALLQHSLAYATLRFCRTSRENLQERKQACYFPEEYCKIAICTCGCKLAILQYFPGNIERLQACIRTGGMLKQEIPATRSGSLYIYIIDYVYTYNNIYSPFGFYTQTAVFLYSLTTGRRGY